MVGLRGFWGRIRAAARGLWRGASYDGPGTPVGPLGVYGGTKGLDWLYPMLAEWRRRPCGQPQSGDTGQRTRDASARGMARLLEKYNPIAQGLLSALRCYTLGDQGMHLEVVARPGAVEDKHL